MAYKITNQRPAVLDWAPALRPDTDGFNPVDELKERLVKQLLQPVDPARPVEVADASGNALDEDGVTGVFLACMTGAYDDSVEAPARELLYQTLVDYDQSRPVTIDRAYAVEAAARAGLPLPDGVTVAYSAATDVIPAAKALLANPADQAARDAFLTGLAFSYEPETLGVAFTTAADFDDFKAFLAGYAAAFPVTPTPATLNLVNEFGRLKMKGELTQTVVLRENGGDGNEPMSFARLLPDAALAYARANPNRAIALPLSIDNLYAPAHMVFANVDAHAHATVRDVNEEWNAIAAAIRNPVRIMSRKHLSSLDAVAKAASHARGAAANAQTNAQAAAALYRSVALPSDRPTPADLARRIAKLSLRLGYVNKSENAVKVMHRTYARPSRRNPDDYNLAGRVTATHYAPDIHLYVDTSGSISESDYADAVKTCIAIARKMDVNLWFNSFSHVISEPTLVLAKGRSAAQMWRQLQRVPKVDGGTDYAQVWGYIQASATRRRELSLMVTDFEYQPPRSGAVHPRNLYYAPCAVRDWDYLVRCTDEFMRNMVPIDPGIRRRVLM